MQMRRRTCSCGSGRLARDCCGRFRRLSASEVALAYLGRQIRDARELLIPFSPEAVAVLREEAASLPARCDLFVDVLRAMPERVIRPRGGDSATLRAAVARAVIALREAGAVDEHLAAAALIDLTQEHSPVCDAAVAQARQVERVVAPRVPVTA